MMAAVCYENGTPDVLRYEELPDPAPGVRDVLICVEAIAIEGGDILNRRLTPFPSVPHVVGYQAAGEVVAVGSDVERFRPGQKVAAFNWSGSHAELFCVPEYYVFGVPEGLDIGVASTVPVCFGTADCSPSAPMAQI